MNKIKETIKVVDKIKINSNNTKLKMMRKKTIKCCFLFGIKYRKFLSLIDTYIRKVSSLKIVE